MDARRMTGVLDPRGDWGRRSCSIARALEVVAPARAFLLLREAFYGATRFDEFVARAGAASRSPPRGCASSSTRACWKEPYKEPGERTRQGYRLTDKGHDLLPVLVALMQWGDRWEHDDDGPVRLQHAGCGATIHAELRCEAGHRVDRGELELAYNR